MKIYIDFDGTLFDTDKYTKDFMDIFNEYGIDKVSFDNTKKILFSDERLFNLDIIIDYFVKEYNFGVELKNEIDNLVSESYVYDEVIDCLDILKNKGYELYLLTYGDKEFQNMKINASNLSKYFKEIIITDKDKNKLDLDYKNSIFIDNNPIEIQKFCNSMAKNVIRIKRENDRYTKIECSTLGVTECKNFNEVVQYLKEGFKNE